VFEVEGTISRPLPDLSGVPAPTRSLWCPCPYQISLVSLPLPDLSGVPQGSVLGPLLIIIYIDGLTNVLSNCNMCLYADNLLLHRPICSPTDYQALQTDIDALPDWISASYSLTGDKCKCIRDPTMPITLQVNGQPLERVYSYKCLGIMLTSYLSWSAHKSTLCSKA